LISLLLQISASCTRKAAEQPPAAFEDAEVQAKALLSQLEVLNINDIEQLALRASRLLLDQRVLDNPAAEESLRTGLEFLSHINDRVEDLKDQLNLSVKRIGELRQEWLDNKEMRPLAMEQLFVEQHKLSDLLMQADYFVNRWNAQLMNIEAFEQAFPQTMD
jgi:hypothetical protein